MPAGGEKMQSEVINDILAVEDRAERIVADANKTAHEILTSADAQASDIIRKAVDEERELGHKAIADAEEQAAESIQTYEEHLKEDYSVDTVISQDTVDQIADKIVERVCSTMFPRRGDSRK